MAIIAALAGCKCGFGLSALNLETFAFTEITFSLVDWGWLVFR